MRIYSVIEYIENSSAEFHIEQKLQFIYLDEKGWSNGSQMYVSVGTIENILRIEYQFGSETR